MNIFKCRNSLSVGIRGERAAVRYLKKIGYKILETNFSNTKGFRLGEIDIIAKDAEEIVFIEVKTRSLFKEILSLPEENITKAKLHKLDKTASFYISKNRLFGYSYRFDAISILADPETKHATLKHIKNIFL